MPELEYPEQEKWHRTGMGVKINGEEYVHIGNLERIARAHAALLDIAGRLQARVTELEAK